MSLTDLVVDEAELQEAAIEKVVSSYVKYSKEGNVIVDPKLLKEPIKKQIMVYLFAKSGLRFLIKATQDEIFVSNEELEKKLGLPGGSVRPNVKRLRDEGLLISKGGRHTISNRAITWGDSLSEN